MSFVRVFLAAIVVTIFNQAWGFLTCGHFFTWIYFLPPVTVWRPPVEMTPMFWGVNAIGHFFLTLIFVAVLRWIAKGLPGAWLMKGVCYGFIVWLTGILPGMFATGMYMTVNPLWTIYMTVNQLIWLPLAGLLAALIALPRRQNIEA